MYTDPVYLHMYIITQSVWNTNTVSLHLYIDPIFSHIYKYQQSQFVYIWK